MTVQNLPTRHGPAPEVTTSNPQQQLNQIPEAAEYAIFRQTVEQWPSVIKGPSLRAPQGTVGLFLRDDDANGPEDGFLIGTEFAHLHPLPDGSLHMVLPPKMHAAALEAGWGVPHPMAGMPTVSTQTILIYAPRDADEREIVTTLIRSAEQFARG